MTMPAKGIEMQFELPSGKPIEVYVLDLSYLLPLEGMFVVKCPSGFVYLRKLDLGGFSEESEL